MSFGSEVKGVIDRKLDEAGLSQHDFVRAALKWQYNWIGLTGAALFALISGTGLPLVLAAGLEMMYVALVPQSDPFRRLVRSWKYAEQERTEFVRSQMEATPLHPRSDADFVAPSYPTGIELQNLVAVLECTSKSLLPEAYRDMDRGEIPRRVGEFSAMSR